MGEVAALVDLKRRREIECRLTPDRALRSIEEAAAFLSDRGLMARMQDSSLPSLFAACHEEALRPGGRGFDLWPKTKWIWSFQLASEQAVVTKLHGGKDALPFTGDGAGFRSLGPPGHQERNRGRSAPPRPPGCGRRIRDRRCRAGAQLGQAAFEAGSGPGSSESGP